MRYAALLALVAATYFAAPALRPLPPPPGITYKVAICAPQDYEGDLMTLHVPMLVGPDARYQWVCRVPSL